MLSLKRKPKTENLEEFRDITDDVVESDFVPYACHWDSNTIVTKNGELLQTIKATGFVHERLESSEDGDYSNLRSLIRDAITKFVDSTKYAVWIHTIRRRKNLKLEGEYKRDFSGYLNHFWNDKNDWEHKFVNEVYITIVHEGKDAKITDADIFMRGVMRRFSNHYLENYLENAQKTLSRVTEKVLGVLELYGARRLGVVKRGDSYYSEICEFFGKLTSLRDDQFPLGEEDLSHALTDYDVTFGYNAMEVRMRSDQRRRFGAMLTVREYRELEIGALDLILMIPAEYIISQSFEFMPTKLAVQGYKYQQELFKTSKAQSLFERTGLKGIIESDKGKNTDFGQHQINIFLLADTIKSLESSVASALKALTHLGMTPIREDIKLEECYWAMLPGNFEFIKRMRPINTARIGGFANLSNLPAGNGQGNHWGSAVTTFYTAARTPYFFNFHKDDNGHTTIIGQEGAGKTVLMNFLLAEARKFNNRLYYFDINRSAEIFIRSMGGVYYNPYPGADSRPYAQVGMNPFELENTPDNQHFLSVWLTSLVAVPDEPALIGIYSKAVAAVMALPKAQRNIRQCVDYIRHEHARIADMFQPWTEGELSHIFSGSQDSLAFDVIANASNIWGFEMGDVILHKEATVPIIAYMLQRVEASLDGTPAILVLSEAWRLLDNAFLAENIEGMMDRFRAKNAMIIFATDHVDEIFGSAINEMLIGKAATQIYLPDMHADDHYMAFSLNENEIYYLSAMNTEDRHFLVKRDNISIVCELNLSGMTDILSVLSATPGNLANMESVINKNGLAHSKWMPAFLGMV